MFIEWARDDQVPHNIQDQYPMAKNTKIMLGNVWPERNTAFPDFLDTQNNTNVWWAGEFAQFHKTLPFDGMWIDMNEPSNFDTGTYSSMEEQLANAKLSCPISGPDSSLDVPPYPTQAVYQRSGEYLFSKTLCMLGKTARRSRNFYDTKNLYGWSEARATYQAIPQVTGKRSAVISRSTFPSSGRYGGHWLGDNTARWEDLQTSVIGVMEFNMFGIPYVGSDICGFNGKSNEELCLRWHQFGAFSPFSRDHNSEGMPDQDPAVWPSVANAARIALGFRYYFLPYLYSLHYNAARYGHTVIRPLFFEYPKDEETLEISEQFLWGSALMIAPALYQGQTTVHAYFPSDTWYSLQPETYGQKMFSGFNDVNAPLSSLTPVFVRGGFILPRQAANTTTTASRLNPFEVLITVKTNAASSVEERNKWMEILGEGFAQQIQKRGDKMSFICRAHFTRKSIEGRRSSHAKPSISSPTGVPTSSASSTGNIDKDDDGFLSVSGAMDVDSVVSSEAMDVGDDEMDGTDEDEEDEEEYSGEDDEEYSGEDEEDDSGEDDGNLSVYEPSSDSMGESGEESEDDDSIDIEYVLVEIGQVVDVLKYCRACRSDCVGVTIGKPSGYAITIKLECSICFNTWQWSSSRNLDGNRGYCVNRDVVSASVSTGNSFSKLSSFFHTIRSPYTHSSAHYATVRDCVRPVVEQLYTETQTEIIDVVVQNAIHHQKDLDLAGDAMFDHPGHTAEHARYAILDVDTNFVLEAELLRKTSKSGNFCFLAVNIELFVLPESSKSLEPKSLDIALTKLKKSLMLPDGTERIGIGSITTDRDPSVAKLLATKYQQIRPFYDGWHFARNVKKSIWKHNLGRYTTWPMFARDIGPDSGSALSTQNLYGVHPFYMCIESDGKAHGVFILNSNAQEVETGPGPHLLYRTIGGRIDMAFFPGPTPEEVINQYLQHIGFPFLPAYWALGYQLCRWGYGSLDAMKTVISRNQAARIPLDVPYADIDYMNHYEDFTEGDNWSGFPAYTQQLHNQGLHLIVIFDPAVEVDYSSFQRGINADAMFIEWARDDQVPHNIQDQYPMAKNTKIMLGNVWPERNTAFPDFLDTQNNTNVWWAGEFAQFHKTLPFDGMWIDMNEPSNFDTGTYSSMEEQLANAKLSCPISGPDSSLDVPPYPTQAVYQRSGEYLFSKTLCMLGKTARRSRNFYDTKNLYGWSEARATYQAIPQVTGKRSAVISRSTFPSSGRYGGHWLGDNTARWEDLQTSVIGVMEFYMFGIPYVGSDICGFNGVSNEELCLRWHQFGAFSPFSRDHNSEGMPDQDPAVWPSVANAARIALGFRYYYLPYLYRSGQTTVHAYFPSDTWYSLQPETYGQKMFSGFNDVNAPLSSLTPVFVRGGFILPRQAANTTTTASRLNPFEVLITVKTNAASSRELYYDNGDDIIPNDNIEQHPRVHWQFSFTSSIVGGVFTGNCETCSTTVKPPNFGYN
ncbi:unnamed protein product [Caenorhabditis nigoni]